MTPLVLYHANCRDGFCAAWILRHHFARFNDADFVPVNYGQDPPDVAGRDVVILDFSYPREVLEQMEERAESLLVLDHHKTAEEALKGLEYAVFDMRRSGAQMTWDYFIGDEYGRHWLVEYTADRDLWKWDLSYSRDVNAGIRSYPLDFEIWDQLSGASWREVANEGKAILRYRNEIIREHTARAQPVWIGGLEGRGAYCSTSDVISEVASDLSEDYDFGCTWFEDNLDIVVSLRSNGGTDVSELAKKFGGGGHKAAAGFKIDRAKFESLCLKLKL